MSVLIVEDGAGVPGANAYIDTAFVDNYFSGDRLVEWQAMNISRQEELIINATKYVDIAFPWKGKRKTLKQGLSWPRTGVTFDDFPVEGIPLQVRQAAAEAVALSMDGEDFFNTESDTGIAAEQVDVIKVSYREPNVKELNKPTRFDALNLRLRGLYKANAAAGSGVTSAKVVRV